MNEYLLRSLERSPEIINKSLSLFISYNWLDPLIMK